MKEKKRVIVSIKPETYIKIKQIAEAEERTMMGMVQKLVEYYEQRRCKND